MAQSLAETIEGFRARLLRREAEAMRAIVRAYLEAAKEIRKGIDSLLTVESLTESEAFRLARLRSLQSQIEREIRRFSAEAAGIVLTAQEAAYGLAIAQTIEILSSFNQLPVGAIARLVGAFESGSPLVELFESIGAGLSGEARRILVSGLAEGLSVQKIARQLRDSLGIGLNRAMTISRTEILNSYRDAAIENYGLNRDVVQGWIWYCALNARTCAMCIAMHGTHHRLEESFASHPRCRCTPIPETDTIRTIEAGGNWLRRQSPETQEAILGKAGYRAIQAGEVRLADFIGEGVSPRWGRFRYQASLREMLGPARAVRFYSRAAVAR